MKNTILILFFSALISFSEASNVNDFCVADLKGPDSPSGYQCKTPDTVTADDFVYTFPTANSSNPYKVAFSPASVTEFPGVNGLGISSTLVVIEKGGFVPMHTHPGGTELIYVVEGELIAGFVTPGKDYMKTLKPGDIMVFPIGQLHFQVNSGKGKAIAFAAYSSANPRLQLLPDLLFANKIPTNLVSLITLLDPAQVSKLKARLVTTNDFVSSFRNSQSAFVKDMPGLNGLGISVERTTLSPRGSIPMHTHAGASEILIAVEGEITAGFITTEEAYVKVLNAGEVMVFPQGLLHFVVNSGKGNATIIATFNSANPTFQYLPNQLFGNNIPSDLIALTTDLDLPQVKKLKVRFGGSG
ncbi:Germin-like protein subfamily 3 member 3, partial [Mucuna pruriens]